MTNSLIHDPKLSIYRRKKVYEESWKDKEAETCKERREMREDIEGKET